MKKDRERCQALNKDGRRGGMRCLRLAVEDGLCRAHNPKLLRELRKQWINAKKERIEIMANYR